MKQHLSHTHALVIGGGIAGLLTARVLLPHFAQITIIERDHFPEAPIFRSGVPQGHHPHVLLERGKQILEDLFPGITKKLLAQNAYHSDIVRDYVLYNGTRAAERFSTGIQTISCSRLLIEWQIRQELARFPEVHFLERQEVTELIPSENHQKVAGVSLRSRSGSIDTQEISELRADLIVDASGRSTHALDWLKTLGYPAPEETVIDAFMGYASRLYAIPENAQHDWHAIVIQGMPEYKRRGAFLLQIEGNHWHVALSGANKDYPPTQDDAFLEFARSLPVPAIYDTIRHAEPLTPIYGYRRTENRWRHFERMSHLPDGFILIGDSVCAFNPIYGQGMSVAALGALSLKNMLQSHSPAEPGFTLAFQKQLTQVYELPWQLAAAADYRIVGPDTKQLSLTTRLLNGYFDTLSALLLTDRQARLAFVQVMNLLQPAQSLFQPGIMLKVMTQKLKTLRNVPSIAAP